MYLVLIDAYSKWLDVKVVSTATSSATIQHLRTIFATHGLPKVLVTNNGSCFISQEFKQFTKLNGIRHVCTAPYHPASNGQAERAVKIVKEALRKCSNESLETYLARFLFHYRLTPQTTTGVAPAELLLGRHPRSHLDLAKPDLHQLIESKQSMQAAKAGGRKEKTLGISSEVFVKNFCNGQRWLPGTITQSSGPKSFMIELTDGRIMRRHVNHMHHRSPTLTPMIEADIDDWTTTVPLSPEVPSVDTRVASPAAAPAVQPLRRSTRARRPPSYFIKEKTWEEVW